MKSEFLKDILLPIDGSNSSLIAEEIALAIAKKIDVRVTVLHVIPNSRSYMDLLVNYDVPTSIANEILGSLEQQADRIISSSKSLFVDEGIRIETEIVSETDVAESILKFSNNRYDLIIIGAHGENEKGLYALGSVAKRVLMHSTCPVLIAKNACHFAKLLVCIDGSNHSFKTLDYAAKLAKNMGSKITLLNVQERRLGASYSKVARELGERIFLKALGTVGDIEPKTDKKLEFGVPSDIIVEVAQKGNYDLIVLGKRGLGNVKRFLLGSVSDDVANNAKCSVMIAPTEA